MALACATAQDGTSVVRDALYWGECGASLSKKVLVHRIGAMARFLHIDA
jgi:hypothetical protein